MQAVGADQGEERRQEAAALRPCPLGDHAAKLADLEKDEADAEQEGDDEP